MVRTFSLRCIFSLFLLTVVSFSFGQTPPTENVSNSSDSKDLETIIHLLGYISRDYPMGVKDGKIINEQEYEEMIEFSQQVLQLTEKSAKLLKDSPNLISEIRMLIDLINKKGAEAAVNIAAGQIKDEIIQVTGLKTAPGIWPSRLNGQKLYAANCASCHGIKGDGNGLNAVGLDPEPTNFLDNELMKEISPYQAYNTIKLGVPGTAMVPFSDLKEDEYWDLAFYVKSLRFNNKDTDTAKLRKTFDAQIKKTDLKQLATLSDMELENSLGIKDNSEELQALRLLKPTANSTGSLDIARNRLNSAFTKYDQGDFSSAKEDALVAYLEGIEPAESRLRSINPSFTMNLEQQMMRVRQVVSKKGQTQLVQNEIEKALRMIDRGEQMMQSQQLNYWLTFILSLSIMLREGMEAFLVLFIVIVIARKLGAHKAAPWIHSGWILAVGMGIAGWFLSDYIIKFGGKNREIMEGAISLFAVVILLWAGYWLHSNSNARKWQRFIKEKIGVYLEKDKMFGLAAFSFMVVFREVFEVILFLKAISLEADANNQSAIGLGSLAAVVILFVIAFFFMKYSSKIPIRQLFLYSSWLVVLLAFILTGKGIHSLQESGLISIHALPSWIQVDWLGIYSTVESVLGQIILIIIVLIAYFYQKKQFNKLKEISVKA